MSKASKKKAAAKLIKQLKKNPRLIKNKRWLRKAGHVDATLPLTVRLNPVVNTTTNPALQKAEAASNDTALIDLTSTFGPEVGQKSTTITGKIEVLARFGNPAEGDDLGDLRIEVTSADLSAASVGVLTGSPSIGPACATIEGATEPARAPNTFQNRPANTSLGSEYADRSVLGGTVSRSSLASSVLPNTVVRTDPIEIGAASSNRVSNRGKANLFQTSNNVRLDLALTANVNTIFRSLEDGSGDSGTPLAAGSLPSASFYCDEAWAGQTNSSGLTSDSFSAPSTTADIGPSMHQNLIVQRVTGALRISPAITTDGKLRIAKVDVTGSFAHSTIDACLQVNSIVQTSGGVPGVNSPVTSGLGSIQAAQLLGGSAGVGGAYFLGAGFGGVGTNITSTTPPTTACDTAYASSTNDPAWPLSHDTGSGGGVAGSGEPLVDEITPTASKRLELDPEIKVNQVTAEALIGQGSDF